MPLPMRDAWFIARKDIQHTLREKSSWLWLFVMPLIFFFFIGNITGGNRMPGASDRRVTIAMEVPDDAGFLAEHLVTRFDEQGYAKEYVIRRGSRTSLDRAASIEKLCTRPYPQPATRASIRWSLCSRRRD